MRERAPTRVRLFCFSRAYQKVSKGVTFRRDLQFVCLLFCCPPLLFPRLRGLPAFSHAIQHPNPHLTSIYEVGRLPILGIHPEARC